MSEGTWEALEHTADVGLRARAGDLTGVFHMAARGLLEIIGVWQPASRLERRVSIVVSARDLEGLLVEWLSEVLYLQDSEDVVVSSIELQGPEDGEIRGLLAVATREGEAPEGTQVKAVTYHRVSVRQEDGDWLAEVYLDV